MSSCKSKFLVIAQIQNSSNKIFPPSLLSISSKAASGSSISPTHSYNLSRPYMNSSLLILLSSEVSIMAKA